MDKPESSGYRLKQGLSTEESGPGTFADSLSSDHGQSSSAVDSSEMPGRIASQSLDLPIINADHALREYSASLPPPVPPVNLNQADEQTIVVRNSLSMLDAKLNELSSQHNEYQALREESQEIFQKLKTEYSAYRDDIEREKPYCHCLGQKQGLAPLQAHRTNFEECLQLLNDFNKKVPLYGGKVEAYQGTPIQFRNAAQDALSRGEDKPMSMGSFEVAFEVKDKLAKQAQLMSDNLQIYKHIVLSIQDSHPYAEAIRNLLNAGSA